MTRIYQYVNLVTRNPEDCSEIRWRSARVRVHRGVMRVMFCQVAYPERHYALVARDDGVVYRLGGGPATPGIPHDLVHYTVEDSLGLSDGIWGAIAGGVVFRSMAHVSGRRPLTCVMLRNTTPPAIAPHIPSLSPSESSTV